MSRYKVEKIEVPEVDVKDFFKQLDIQITKKGITDKEVLQIIEDTWTYINKLQVSCLRMQSHSIEFLKKDLEILNLAKTPKELLNEYKQLNTKTKA